MHSCYCCFRVGHDSLCDDYIFSESFDGLTKNFIFLVLGVTLMLVTGTFMAESGLREARINQSQTETWWMKLRLHIKALIALSGCVLYWLGAWNLLDLYTFPSTPRRNICFIFVGLFCYIVTDTMLVSAGLNAYLPQTSAQLNALRWKQQLFLYVRSSICMFGGILYWIGWWELLTDHIPNGRSVEHQTAYLLVGIVFLIATNTFFSTAGVVPPLQTVRNDYSVHGLQHNLDHDRKILEEENVAATLSSLDSASDIEYEHVDIEHAEPLISVTMMSPNSIALRNVSNSDLLRDTLLPPDFVNININAEKSK